jgi:CBS domain-containing protein
MPAESEPKPPLQRLRVIDVMHPGVIACPFETPLRTVARMMATYRVHAIMVIAHEADELPHGSLWGVISDADLIRAARTADLDTETARSLATTPALTVTSVEPVERAVELMAEHAASHLIVVERHSMRPIGVVSTLDVARALAGLTDGL